MRAAFLFVSLSFFVLVYGQERAYEEFGSQEGLEFPSITALAEGPMGQLWVGTEGGGLWRFQGRHFMPEPFAGRYVRALRFFNNRLYVGTESGLWESDGLHYYPVAALGSAKVNQLDTVNNQLAVATEQDGVFLLSQGQWKHMNVAGSVQRMFMFQGKLGVAGSAGVVLLNSNQVLETEPVSDALVHKDTLWIIGQEGLFSIPATQVTQMGIRGLVASGGSLFAYNGRTGYIERKAGSWKFVGQDQGLPNGKIRNVLVDRYNNLWLATANGLVVERYQGFELLVPSTGEMASVVAAAQWGTSTWAGAQHSLFEVADARWLNRLEASDNLPQGLLLCMVATSNGLLLGTESGLYWESSSGLIPLGLEEDFIFSLVAEGDDQVHVGAASGWWVLERSGNGWKLGNQPLVEEPMPGLKQSELGVHALTYGNGLLVLERNGLKRYTSWQGVALDTLFAEDWQLIDRTLFVANSASGLLALGPEGVQTIGTLKGLLDPEVLALQEDEGGLWVTTTRGIHHFIQTPGGWQLTARHSTARDWGGNRLNSRSLYIGNSDVFVGTSRGLLVGKKQALLNAAYKPAVLLEAVQYLFNPNLSLQEHARGVTPWTRLPLQLVLPYELNYLKFSFTGVGVQSQEELAFYYVLEGQDTSVTPAGASMEAIFTDLNPGKYAFKVWAQAPGGQRSDVVSYEFEVLAPFWLTWWFIVAMVFLGTSLLAAAILWRIKRIKYRAGLERDLVDMERKALALQMNPHFIFNALDSISGFIFKQDAKGAVRYLGHFAKLMRSTLEASQEHFIVLQTEVEILRHYLELEQLRHNYKFSFSIEVDEELLPYVELPPMMVQPHVENAIKHGLKPLDAGGQLVVRFSTTTKELVVEVMDNGVGRARSKEIQSRNPLGKPKSMSTEIGKRRVELLQKTWGGQVRMEIQDLYHPDGTAAGTRVELRMPLQLVED